MPRFVALAQSKLASFTPDADAPMSRSPLRVSSRAPETVAVTSLSRLLKASDRPTEIANEVWPENEAANEAAPDTASMEPVPSARTAIDRAAIVFASATGASMRASRLEKMRFSA